MQAASQKRDISFRYIFSRPGLGQADNTNQGIRNASGQYIRILHSDDIIHPRTIEFELSHLDKLTKENVLALHDVVVFSDEKPTFSDPQTPEIRDRQFFIDKWLSTRTALPSSMIFSKSLLKKCGPMNRKYNFLCDWEFFYRLVLGAEEIIHFPRGYIGWRKHSNSVTGNSWFLHYSEFSDLMEFMKDDLKNRGIKPNGGFRHFTRQGMRYRYSRIFSDYGNLSLREKITNIPKIARSFVCDPFFYRIVITTVILDPSRQLIRKSWKPVQ